MKILLIFLLCLFAVTVFGKSMVGTNEVTELKAFDPSQFSTNSGATKQVRIKGGAITITNLDSSLSNSLYSTVIITNAANLFVGDTNGIVYTGGGNAKLVIIQSGTPGGITNGQSGVNLPSLTSFGYSPEANLLQLKNTATNGYTAIQFQDYLGNQAMTVGYGNPSNGAPITQDRDYFYHSKTFIISPNLATNTTTFFHQSGGISSGTATDPGIGNLTITGTNSAAAVNVSAATIDGGAGNQALLKLRRADTSGYSQLGFYTGTTLDWIFETENGGSYMRFLNDSTGAELRLSPTGTHTLTSHNAADYGTFRIVDNGTGTPSLNLENRNFTREMSFYMDQNTNSRVNNNVVTEFNPRGGDSLDPAEASKDFPGWIVDMTYKTNGQFRYFNIWHLDSQNQNLTFFASHYTNDWTVGQTNGTMGHINIKEWATGGVTIGGDTSTAVSPGADNLQVIGTNSAAYFSGDGSLLSNTPAPAVLAGSNITVTASGGILGPTNYTIYMTAAQLTTLLGSVTVPAGSLPNPLLTSSWIIYSNAATTPYPWALARGNEIVFGTNGVATETNNVATGDFATKGSISSGALNAAGAVTFSAVNVVISIPSSGGFRTPAGGTIYEDSSTFLIRDPTSFTNRVNISGTGAVFSVPISSSTTVTATNGVASYKSNLVAAATITVGASPFNWTNTSGINAVVYVDGISVTGTTGVNGGVDFNSIGQNTQLLGPSEYITITYTIGTPTARWRPR